MDGVGGFNNASIKCARWHIESSSLNSIYAELRKVPLESGLKYRVSILIFIM